MRLAFAEKGLEWISRHVNLRQGEQVHPDYLKLNPKGEVPTLVHDGNVVTESAVICEYLEDCFPGPPLRPTDPPSRAMMRTWTRLPDAHIHADTATISSCTYLRVLHLRMTPEKQAAYLRAVPDPERLRRKVETLDQGTDWPPFEGAVKRVRKAFSDMERVLTEHRQDWLLGEDLTLADIAIVPYATRMDMLGLQGLFKDLPAVTQWLDRLQSRPAFKTAFWDWFKPGYADMIREAGAAAADRVSAIIAQ